MEPATSAASTEQMMSEDDEERFLLRCPVAENDRNYNDISAILGAESDQRDLDGQTRMEASPKPGHTVICTISLALALPRRDQAELISTVETGKEKTKKDLCSGLVEVPKPLYGYYHIEYNLLPDNSAPIKVDLVMFGMTAKIYMENETKVLKPWLDGDQLWLGWNQSVKLNVSRDLLVKMLGHKITFRVWDTKDRVSNKARYDRPKAFRLPLDKKTEDSDQTGDIRSLVYKLRAAYEKENPRPRKPVNFHRVNLAKDNSYATVHPKLSAVESNEKAFSSVALSAGGSKGQETEELTNQRGEDVTTNNIHKAILDQDKNLVVSKSANKPSSHCTKGQKDTSTISTLPMLKDKGLVTCKKKSAHKLAQENPAEMEQIRRNGVASVELSAMYLLAGDRSLTGCFVSRSGQVCEGFCGIILDQPLMSEQLKAKLNPLVITILSASSLPSSPVPFNVLQQKCLPVYCQYKFHNLPVHRTKGQQHGSEIYFRDVNVILTGLLSTAELLESLRGPVIEIEVHDHDRKAEKPPTCPAIFGTELGDDKLASAASATTRRTTHISKLHHPYGVAKLNLSDLLRGHRCMNLSLPIRGQRAALDKSDWEGKLPEKADALYVSEDNFMPMGHYIEANSKLRVKVEIAKLLVPEPDQSEDPCPFGRIVYIFNYDNVSVRTKLRSVILRVNAAAFQLDSYSEETAQKALSTYRMNAKERADKKLNVLTGFHMLDRSLHLFILEGLKEQAIQQLWETVLIGLDDDVKKEVDVLYNSSLSFSKRLYDTLDMGFNPLYLHHPLNTILKEPLVYVRDMLPYTCLQALLRINHLSRVKTLEEVVQNDLFPSAKMIFSLKQEFGIVPKKGMEMEVDIKDSQDSSYQRVSQRKTHTLLNTFNEEYLEWKQSQADQGPYTKNFVQANIEEVHKASRVLQRQKPKVFVAKVDDGQPAHNYSVQKMNCTALAHELLRKEMAKVPACRFSYNQNYHSFTVDPVDMEAALKASELKSRAAWRTCDGFIYPGFRSSIESNVHPKRPDEARVEELKKPWKENLLHRNTLSATLNRSRWPWSQHHEDFQLYAKPHAVFSPEPPVSIYLSGESLRQEQLQTANAQYSRWLKKILPTKDSEGSRRVPEFKCHMRQDGLDKLQDLLKDKPMKPSLRSEWRILKPVQAFPVAQLPDKSSRERDSSSQVHTKSDTSQRVQHSLPYFGCYWRPHSFQHKRAALPLTDEEKQLHIFQKRPHMTKITSDHPISHKPTA
ncbi:uncharacterized protein cfap92 [Salminus brasiliensis]|uniref:uncharacterized protein cfap92 n=1 Tax=Salminus brasiliensis TaxID=930266 RepID=UPI003B831F27